MTSETTEKQRRAAVRSASSSSTTTRCSAPGCAASSRRAAGVVEIVGEAGDVDQAVAVIDAQQPDVVLLDVHLPGGGGVQVVKRAKSAGTATSRCR